MITGLHYRAAACSPHGLTESMREARLLRLTQISKAYRQTILEIQEFQRSMSVQVASSLTEDILAELKIIAKPIFNSLTQLEVGYLAFRMQQMAILSEAMLAIDHIKKNVDRVVVSKEITKVFDELKVAILEIGYDFHHLAPAEQLNEKIEALRQRKLKEYAETMDRYRTEILRKRTILEDLAKQKRLLEKELSSGAREALGQRGSSVSFGENVSMPLTEIAALIAYQRQFSDAI